MLNLVPVLRVAGDVLLAAAAAYPLIAIMAVWVRRQRTRVRRQAILARPVTVLKPLCGAEPRLYENLRSFCQQDFPAYQVIFGARHPDDPALAVARRLQSEHPGLDIAVVADERVHGSNMKVSNLINLLAHARHDVLVLADSDIRVPPDYLRRVTAPLGRPEVGVVTCLYRGFAVAGAWSRLGAQFVNEWFASSVCVANLFGSTFFALGATIALRRDTLNAIGGFASVANQLADDYRLGERTRQCGFNTVLSECEVVSDVVETRLADLAAHELRWLRTIRSVQPAGYFGSLVMFTLPLAAAGFALAGAAPLSVGLLAAAIAGRLLLHWKCSPGSGTALSTPNRVADLGLFLIRDWLSFALWLLAFAGRSVHWRGRRLTIDAEGSAVIEASL